jgi:imidazoleglycerol phosphate dehydratase HisB
VLSTTLLDGAALDVLSPLEDALASAEVDVSGREVVQALVIAAVIVVLDEVA